VKLMLRHLGEERTLSLHDGDTPVRDFRAIRLRKVFAIHDASEMISTMPAGRSLASPTAARSLGHAARRRTQDTLAPKCGLRDAMIEEQARFDAELGHVERVGHDQERVDVLRLRRHARRSR
jgi:hypothetical protein